MNGCLTVPYNSLFPDPGKGRECLAPRTQVCFPREEMERPHEGQWPLAAVGPRYQTLSKGQAVECGRPNVGRKKKRTGTLELPRPLCDRALSGLFDRRQRLYCRQENPLVQRLMFLSHGLQEDHVGRPIPLR